MGDNKETGQWLTLALLEAQRRISAVARDSTNQHHKYQYVAAETMILEAKRILNECGLVLTRTASSVVVDGAMVSVLMTYLLEHPESGAERHYTQEVPAVEGKGRPIDKAVLGTQTTAWSYFLRDLLLIARGDENEIDRRIDAPDPKKMNEAELRQHVAGLVQEWSGVAKSDMRSALQAVKVYAGFDGVDKLDREQMILMAELVAGHIEAREPWAVVSPNTKKATRTERLANKLGAETTITAEDIQF